MAHGLPAAEARRLALVSIGGMEQARYRHREARGLMSIDILMQDLKYTLRTLWRDPGFTAVAVLILALGDRREYRGVQRGEHAAAAAAAVSQCAAAGVDCAAADQVRAVVRDIFDGCLRRVSRDEPVVPGRDGILCVFEPGQSEPESLGGAPIPATSIDVIANFFQVLGVQPADGAAVHAGRCAQRRGARWCC